MQIPRHPPQPCILAALKGISEQVMNSHLAPEVPDNFVEVPANSLLLAANFAAFSGTSGTACLVLAYTELP
jgi:hypothetical protein